MNGFIRYACKPIRFHGIVVKSGHFYGFHNAQLFVSDGIIDPKTHYARVLKLVNGTWKSLLMKNDLSEALAREYLNIQTAREAVFNRKIEQKRLCDPETYREYTRMSEVPKPSTSVTF